MIALACFAVYSNTLYNGLVWDDVHLIKENPWLTDFRRIPEIFRADAVGFEKGDLSGFYRPLMHIIYMLTYHLLSPRPWGFHLVNVLFHSGSSILVFLIALEVLNRSAESRRSPYLSPPFIAALLFAVHPIHTEAVAWVASICDLSYTFFCLLSLYCFMRSGRGSSVGYGFSVLAFFLATLCKETALVFPLVLLAYDLAIEETSFRPLKYIKRYIPYVAVVGLYVFMRFSAIHGLGELKRWHSGLTLYGYFINSFPLLISYLGKLLFPVRLNAYYVFKPLTSAFEPASILALALSAAFIFFFYLSLRTDKRIFFSLSVIVIPLLPAFYAALANSNFAERHLYFSSVGFVMAAALVMGRPRSSGYKRTAALVLLSVLVVLYSAGTIGRNTVWKDNYTLWSDTVKKSPDGAVPHILLADTLFSEKGRIDDAIEHYEIALRLQPGAATGHNNLGLAYAAKGWTGQAIEQFQIALRLQPDSAETYNNLGLAYKKAGLLDDAIKCFEMALRLRPDQAGVHQNLARAYEMKGMPDKAREHEIEAFRLEGRQ